MTPALPRRPALRYHGSKWRLAPWIISRFPPHKVYVEAFGGSGSILLRKPPSKIEVYNDLDGDVVNFFRVLRDPATRAQLCELAALTPYSRDEYDAAFEPATDPVERARRLLVRAQLGFGSNAGTRKTRCGFRGADWTARQANNLYFPRVPENLARAGHRFAGVIIENRPAVELLNAQDSEGTLFYLDPPYVHSTRTKTAADASYHHEMTDEDHRALAVAAHAVRGYVLLSGYESPLYDELYAGWPKVITTARTQGNAVDVARREVLWLSPRTAAAELSLFAEHGA